MNRPIGKYACFILSATMLAMAVSCSRPQDTGRDSIDSTDSALMIVEDPAEETLPDSPTLNSPEEALSYMMQSPDSASYSEGILPTMAEEVPEYCYKLLKSKYDRFLIVDKRRMKVIRYDRFGRTEKEYPMACAKNYGHKSKKGDSRTPEGFFHVRGIYDSTDWLFTDDDGNTSPQKGQFGPRYIRIYPQIGIHGTCAPWSIGGRRSHGCIRLTNDNILELVEYVDSGMPVIVSPGPKDMLVNKQEGRFIPAVTTALGSGRSRPAAENKNSQPDNTVQADSVASPSVSDSIPAPQEAANDSI